MRTRLVILGLSVLGAACTGWLIDYQGTKCNSDGSCGGKLVCDLASYTCRDRVSAVDGGSIADGAIPAGQDAEVFDSGCRPLFAPCGAKCCVEVAPEPVAAGVDHTCALTATRVMCWGNNADGRLATVPDGGAVVTLPTEVPYFSDPINRGGTALTAGDGHTCILNPGDESYPYATPECWGDNTDGRLSANYLSVWETPGSPDVTISDYTLQLTAGRKMTCAIDWNGQAQRVEEHCVGMSPALDAAMDGLSQIRAGDGKACAINASRGLTCWNFDANDPQGAGVSVVAKAVSLSIGPKNVCYADTDGLAWCWGAGDQGQLGDGRQQASTTPAYKVVKSDDTVLEQVKQVVVGDSHACARTGSGGVYCWGSNSLGQVGDGTKGIQRTKAALTLLTEGATFIAAGGDHSCAVGTSRRLFCWGGNANGEVGSGASGTGAEVTSPTEVLNLDN